MKRQSLGGYIVRVCPYKDHEFTTDNPNKKYCSEKHKIAHTQQKRRARQYAERESLPISSKPGASYRVLSMPEVTGEVPVKYTSAKDAPKPVVERYQKIPMRALSNFQSTYAAHLPNLDEGLCPHGRWGQCESCWLGL